jgi:hypothetical protein
MDLEHPARKKARTDDNLEKGEGLGVFRPIILRPIAMAPGLIQQESESILNDPVYRHYCAWPQGGRFISITEESGMNAAMGSIKITGRIQTSSNTSDVSLSGEGSKSSVGVTSTYDMNS